MKLPESIQKDVELIDKALAGLLESCTVPIFAEKWKYIRPHATGTLIRLGQYSFVTTAAHAPIEAAGEGCPLLIGGLQSAKVFGLPEDITLSTKKGMLDLAVWRIHPEFVDLFDEKRFLTLEDMWLHDVDPGTGPFVLHGFFADERGAAGPDLLKGRVDSTRIYMNRFSGPVTEEFYRPQDHLLFSGKRAHVFDSDGFPGKLPPGELRGISGSGIFGVSLKGRPHRLVAVETRAQPLAIQGTRISRLVELIGSKYSDIRELVATHCERDQREAEARKTQLLSLFGDKRPSS